MNYEQLAGLKAELTRQRDELVQEANRQIAFLNGKLDMIEQLLAAGPDEQSPNGEVHEAVAVEAD